MFEVPKGKERDEQLPGWFMELLRVHISGGTLTLPLNGGREARQDQRAHWVGLAESFGLLAEASGCMVIIRRKEAIA